MNAFHEIMHVAVILAKIWSCIKRSGALKQGMLNTAGKHSLAKIQNGCQPYIFK